ncbi:hypothetical protein LBMAG43_18840 [Methylococcaceae bacterium]|jgi:hypothetical protein|nr:hypothetical protein [Methylococcales bacterium]GDX85842.1 hypothetical protein LBMAG43_18840 [Methylococcaceae bacterium]
MMRMVMEVVMVLGIVGLMVFLIRVSKTESNAETPLQDHDEESDR